MSCISNFKDRKRCNFTVKNMMIKQNVNPKNVTETQFKKFLLLYCCYIMKKGGWLSIILAMSGLGLKSGSHNLEAIENICPKCLK